MTFAFIALSLLLLLAIWFTTTRNWRTALLCLIVGSGLFLLWWQPRWLPASTSESTISNADPLLRKELQSQSTNVFSDDITLNEKSWQELPAREIQWQRQEIPKLNLKFDSTASVARLWQLQIEFEHGQAWHAELIDESGSVVVQSDDSTNEKTSLQWVPSVAENILFKLRIIDANKSVLHEGPLALAVLPAQSFNVELRLASPSFDAQFLKTGFTQSRLRWQIATELGQNTRWQQRSDADQFAADATIVDARRFENASQHERDSWLQRKNKHAPLLLVDFGGAKNTRFWQQQMQLTFENADSRKLQHWPLQLAEQQPKSAKWRAVHFDQQQSPGLYQFEDKAIYWLAIQGWHQAQINQPLPVYHFWQNIFDAMVVSKTVDEKWQPLTNIAYINERQDVCIDSKIAPAITLNAAHELIAFASTTSAQRYCTSFWPKQTGWHTLTSQQARLDFYVYGENDWLLWKQNRNKLVAMEYQKREKIWNAAPLKTTIPDIVLVVLVLASLLMLWWKEFGGKS